MKKIPKQQGKNLTVESLTGSAKPINYYDSDPRVRSRGHIKPEIKNTTKQNINSKYLSLKNSPTPIPIANSMIRE
ncbi:MAG: hypothetical protein NT009_05075 [Proteobacteria bacterium]|nr:hypothetical protein [Pseudomonadota bacterium]